MRVVSLLPSATEVLFAVGAGDDVVGVTFECDHPPQARERRVVSTSSLPEGLDPAGIDRVVRERIAAGEDLYRLDEGALHALDPDLVVTQDLCAVCAVDVTTVSSALDFLGCTGRVLTVDPMRLDDVLASVTTIGEAVGRAEPARALEAALRARLAAITAAVAGRPRPRVAVLEWTDPPFEPGHWVPDLVDAAGGECVLGTAGARSVPTSWSALAASRPDVVLVAPCGYRLDAAAGLATGLLDAGVLPAGAQVWAVDADACVVRPGPRLVDGVEALAAALHPGAAPGRPDVVRRITPA